MFLAGGHTSTVLLATTTGFLVFLRRDHEGLSQQQDQDD